MKSIKIPIIYYTENHTNEQIIDIDLMVELLRQEVLSIEAYECDTE